MQRKTRLATDLPRDWKKRVEEYICKLNRQSSEDHLGYIDEKMAYLLGKDEVQTTAEILWGLAVKRGSYVRDRFSALIYEALSILVHTLDTPAPVSRSDYETIINC
jgi:hypothetical protein